MRKPSWQSQKREPTMAVIPRLPDSGDSPSLQMLSGGRSSHRPKNVMHLRFDAKIILQDRLQALGIARLGRQPAREKKLCPVRHRVLSLQGLHADAQKAADEFREVLVVRPVQVHRLLVHRPGPVEKDWPAGD